MNKPGEHAFAAKGEHDGSGASSGGKADLNGGISTTPASPQSVDALVQGAASIPSRLPGIAPSNGVLPPTNAFAVRFMIDSGRSDQSRSPRSAVGLAILMCKYDGTSLFSLASQVQLV
jgi:hypothetical protein